MDGLDGETRASGSTVEVVDHPGSGHLFTDPSLPAEHDEHAAAVLWERAAALCHDVTR